MDFVRVSGDVISENFSDLDTGWGDVVSGNFDAENDADADLMKLGFVRVRHGERRRCGLGARGRGQLRLRCGERRRLGCCGWRC